jgi:RHS repeat-associated protein
MKMESLPDAPQASKRKLEFAYDYQGRRIQKDVCTNNPSTLTYELSTRTKFAYDGWNLLATLTSDLRPLTSFTWGLDLSGSEQGAGGVGGLLWESEISNTQIIDSHFPAYDGNGNVMTLVKSSDGTESARYEYGPFGELLRATGPMALANPFRFSTKFQDDETGLIYYGYRYYNASTGRWLDLDPINENGGINLYAFIENNSANWNDILGLALYAFDGTGQVYSDGTHVAMLHYSYTEKAEYENGVGSDFNGPFDNSLVGGLTGYGAKSRLESMYKKFVDNYKSGDHDVDIIGFSRGAALAREFANMIYERGFPQKTQHMLMFRSKYLNFDFRYNTSSKCRVKIRFVGLFDTVGSFGKPGNYIDLGFRMKLPPNVENAAQAIARDEKRALFPLTRLNTPGGQQKFSEQIFPGDHSDIGGGWGSDQNMLAKAPLEYIWTKGKAAGVPFGALPPRNLIDSYISHDNRGIGHSLVTIALYDLHLMAIILNGFYWPTQPRNLE